MGAYIHFDQTGVSVTGQKGEALHLLTMSLAEEYKLFVDPPNQRDNRDLFQNMLQKISQAWAEAGKKLPKLRQRLGDLGLQPTVPHPLQIQLKTGAKPMHVK